VPDQRQETVKSPGDGQHEPDERAPHGSRLPVDTAGMQQIHFPAWQPRLRKARPPPPRPRTW
jgi:hypothetical protein